MDYFVGDMNYDNYIDDKDLFDNSYNNTGMFYWSECKGHSKKE